MSSAGRVIPGPCGSLIGRGQPERLGPRRGGGVPALCRRFAGFPGGGLALGCGLAAVGLRGGVPVLILVAARAVRRCRGISAVLARPPPAGSPLRASGFAATRTPPGKLAARRLVAAPLPVTPVTCGGLTPGGLAVAPWTPGWLAVARRAPASVTFGPGPVPSRGLTGGGGTGRRIAGARSGSGGGPHGAAATGCVGRRALAAATVGYGGALGRYRAWPPPGTRTGCGLLWPFGEVAVLFATVAPAATARSCPVVGCLPRTRTGRGGPHPGRPAPRRPGPGDISGCPAGPDVPRGCFTEKLSAPEQNSDAECDRRENAHGDRSVDQSEAGREHPGHQHRHSRDRQEGAGPDHVRPPTARRGAPGGWLPAVV
jgi:hypothetical protein